MPTSHVVAKGLKSTGAVESINRARDARQSRSIRFNEELRREAARDVDLLRVLVEVGFRTRVAPIAL